MHTILRFVAISIISTSIGCLPLLVSMIVTAQFSKNGLDIKGFSQILGFFIIVILNGSILVFCIGSTLYTILLKFKLANYLTSFFMGGLTLLFNSYDSHFILLTTSGFIIGPLFHYYYNKYNVRCK